MFSEDIKQRLEAIVGSENVETSNASLLAYSYDSTPQFQAMPDAAVAPRNTEEVSLVVKLCNEHKIPIVPRGSGTNLCAGTTPLEGGIVLLFRHMNQIRSEDHTSEL